MSGRIIRALCSAQDGLVLSPHWPSRSRLIISVYHLNGYIWPGTLALRSISFDLPRALLESLRILWMSVMTVKSNSPTAPGHIALSDGPAWGVARIINLNTQFAPVCSRTRRPLRPPRPQRRPLLGAPSKPAFDGYPMFSLVILHISTFRGSRVSADQANFFPRPWCLVSRIQVTRGCAPVRKDLWQSCVAVLIGLRWGEFPLFLHRLRPLFHSLFRVQIFQLGGRCINDPPAWLALSRGRVQHSPADAAVECNYMKKLAQSAGEKKHNFLF